MSVPPTIDLSEAERLSGSRLRAIADVFRNASAECTVVKLTPDAAAATADLIELLARHAGIELPEPVQP